MKAKSVLVQEVYIQKKSLSSLKLQTVSGLKKSTGYDVLALEKACFVDSEYIEGQDNKNGKALTNNHSIEGSILKEKIINFTNIDIPDEPTSVPVFGVTLDDNMNVIQINIDSQDIERDAALSSAVACGEIDYWDLEESLHAGEKTLERSDFERLLLAIKKIGHTNPLVLYADKNFIRPYYYDITPYIYNFVGYKELPVRVITYKDYAYVKKLSPILYSIIRTVPTNAYYEPLDNTDCSEYMLDNFSDKRAIIKEYMKHVEPEKAKHVQKMDIDKLIEIIPYFFYDDMEDKNIEFLDSVMSREYPPIEMMHDGKFSDSMTISESLYRYMKGATPIEEEKIGLEKVDLSKCKKVNEIDFEPELYPFDTFDYIDYANDENAAFEKKACEKFGFPCAHEKHWEQIICMNRIDEILKNKKSKVVLFGADV